MRVTIICDDRTVIVDGDPRVVGKEVAMPSNVAAIQWYGKRGEIEYKVDEYGRRPQNEEFFDLAPYQHLVDEHAKAKERDENALREAEEKRNSAQKKREEAEREEKEASQLYERVNRLATGQG